MCCRICSLPMVLLICAVVAAPAALCQSLSIVKKGESAYQIEASAPSDNLYTLQASGDLRLWVDIQDEVQGQYTYQLDGAGISQRYFRLTPSTPAPPIRVMLLGDSMTADCCGWGQGFYDYFKPNATVVNYAMAWTSSKVFLRSEEKDKMLLLKPDYVLIQFGFVDQAWGPDLAPNEYTTLEEFADNLRTIVEMVREFNGVPIMVTLHSARLWDADGKVIPTWLKRNTVTKEVAAELQTPLIDLNQLTLDLFNELGPNGTDFMHWEPGGPEDVMHLSLAGAKVVAQLVAKALPDSLGPYLIGTLDPPPIP